MIRGFNAHFDLSVIFKSNYTSLFHSGGGQKQRFRVGKLHLVDLAGSERQSKTGATGQRLKEATKVRRKSFR